jgi:hypothetical protein
MFMVELSLSLSLSLILILILPPRGDEKGTGLPDRIQTFTRYRPARFKAHLSRGKLSRAEPRDWALVPQIQQRDTI